MTWRKPAAASACLLASLAFMAASPMPLRAQSAPAARDEPSRPARLIPEKTSEAKVIPASPTIRQTGGDRARANFTVEGIHIATGDQIVRATRLDIEGTSLLQADLDALLDPKSSEALAARLKRLSADHVRISELTIDRPDAWRQVYRDVLLDGLKDGRAARLTTAYGTFLDGSGTSQASFGRSEARDVDVGLSLDLGASSGASEGGALFSSLTVEAFTTDDGAGGSIKIGSIRLGEVRARAPERGFAETIRVATSKASGDAPDAKQAQASALLRLIQSVDVGSAEIRDIQTTSGDGDARVEMLGYDLDVERRDRFRMSGFSSGNGEGRFTVSDAAATGIDVKATAALLAERAFRDVSTVSSVRPWTMHLGHLAFQTPRSDEASAASGEPDLFVEAIDLQGSSVGDRSTGTLALSNIRVPVRPGGAGRALADLGYDHVAGTLSLTSSYDATERRLNLDRMSLISPDLGSIRGSAALGDVGPEVFSADRQVVLDALAKASIHSMTLSVQDDGLSHKILAALAQRDGQSEGDLRQSYARQAALVTGFLLGGSTDAIQLGSALSRFIADSGQLTVVATPRDRHLQAAELLSIAAGSRDGFLHAFKIEATKE